MRFLPILFFAILAGCSLSPQTSEETYSYTTTLKKEASDKLLESLAICVKESLKKHYPSASLTNITAHHYKGIIPGPTANSPIAKFDVFSPTSDFLGVITLQQKQPIDQNITRLFKECL